MRRLSRRKILGGGVVLLGGAGVAVWRLSTPKRPQPPALQETLFMGVVYERQSTQQPRPMILHSLTIDLDTPGLGFLVTPGKAEAERPYVGKKTTAFLAENGCQLAVNADFFYPWRSVGTWDYYPHTGDPVSVEGDSISNGAVCAVSDGHPHQTTLWISKENAVSIGDRPTAVWNACGGHKIALDGTAADTDLSPRVAVGTAEKKLLILLIDGRQDGYSEGATLKDLAVWFLARGATAAINLDGGGSATLVVQGRGILNSPIDCKIPGRERPVANHLGVFANKLA